MKSRTLARVAAIGISAGAVIITGVTYATMNADAAPLPVARITPVSHLEVVPGSVTDHDAALRWNFDLGAVAYRVVVTSVHSHARVEVVNTRHLDAEITKLQPGTAYDVTVTALGPHGQSRPADLVFTTKHDVWHGKPSDFRR